MGFNISQIINKILNVNIEKSDVAVPVDLQYHTIDNPIPVERQTTVKHTTLVTNVLVSAGGRYDSGYIIAVGNSVDLGIRLVGVGGNCKVMLAPYPSEYSTQIGAETVIADGVGSHFRTMSSIRTTSPRFKILVDNKGTTDFSIQVLSITQHLGG